MTDRVAHYAGWRVVNMVQVPYAPVGVQTDSLLYEFVQGRTNVPMLVCRAYTVPSVLPIVVEGFEAYVLYPGGFSYEYDVGSGGSGNPELAFGYYGRGFIAQVGDIDITELTLTTRVSKWSGNFGATAASIGESVTSGPFDIVAYPLTIGYGSVVSYASSVANPAVMTFFSRGIGGGEGGGGIELIEVYGAGDGSLLNAFTVPAPPPDAQFLSDTFSNVVVAGVSYTRFDTVLTDTGDIIQNMAIWTPSSFAIPDGSFSSSFYEVSVDDVNAQYIIDNKDLVITSKWGWIFCGKLAGEDRTRFIMVNYDWTKCWRIAPVGGDVYATELLARVAAGLNGASMAQDELGNFHLVERTSSSGAAFPPNIIWAGYTAPPGSKPPEDNATAEEPAWEGDVPTVEALPFIEAQPSVEVNPDMNRLRAWTFTLDGHDYYVLRLGEDVTLVYDTITRQWSEWATADWDVWRVNVGLNWGSQDIVAGDLAEGQLWNIDPVARLDDITIPITTVVTGGLPMRGLDSVPCGVMLTGSLGEPAADSEGIGVRLETSDDNGKTFTDHGQVPLLTGENYQPTWLSIGQISAPGRVFKFTDVGGMARVDGADNLDG